MNHLYICTDFLSKFDVLFALEGDFLKKRNNYINNKTYLMKRFSTMLMMLLMFIGVSSNAQDLVITGVIDGPLTGGVPKALELYAINDIADLSVYGVASVTNGAGSSGVTEFDFPADALNEGDFIYLSTETDGFTAFFGFAPDYTDNVLSVNGDDAIELYLNGSIIDVFGDVDVDGSGEPWEYLDGWAYRVSNTGPDGSSFVVGNFTYSGPNALDGETTNGSAATPFPIGTYTAGAPTTVATPAISPASGDYFDPITVTMTCGTAGATIYYTTDGTDPDNTDTEFTAGFNVSTATTVKAIAYKAGLTTSNIATNTYTFPTVTNISTIAQLRTQTVGGGDYYKLTGEAVLTYQQAYRGQKYIQDATAAILIDDDGGTITTTYSINDGITNITGTLGEYGGMLQFVPSEDPGAATSSGNTISPQVVTLDDLTADFEDYEAELVKVEGVTFVDAGDNFVNGTVYAISDGSKATYNFRTSFYGVDYIGTAIPAGSQDLVLIPNSRTDGEYVTSRDAADINPASSANPATKLDITSINGGNAVYENQAFTVTVQAQDVNGAGANVDTDVDITLSIGTGTGTLGGTITGTISNGTNSVTISGTTYGPFENGVVLNVDDDASNLASGNSDAFNVLEVVVADLVITEIMYKGMPGEDTLEYFELYNNGSSTINLENYSITEGVTHTFGNVAISAGSYLLLAKNASAIQDAFGLSAVEWTSGGLKNTGEDIEIRDATDNVVVYVDYGSGTPWPDTETGKSIRFCDPSQDNNLGDNWGISVELLTTIDGQDIYGTPLEDCGAATLTADFEADDTSILEGENVSFTDLSAGNPTSWEWVFEGGTPGTSDVQNPTNIVYNTAGDFDVTLTIHLGGDNDVETKVNYIHVENNSTPPVADFEADLTTVSEGETVNFTDLSTNTPTSYLWTFEGGSPATSTVENPSVSYATAGTYDVTLYVENADGNDTELKVDYITVSTEVVADFEADDTSITEGGTVNFTDLSINNPTSYLWTFEGGTPATSTEQNPSVSYATAGTYDVTLYVEDANGNDTEIKVDYIAVLVPLAADFEADETDIMAGDAINFTDLSEGNPTSWEWVFSGGTPNTSDVQNPTNIVYNTPGDYNVTLTIHLGDADDTETKVAYIHVGDPTIPPVADFEADATTVFEGQTINFTDLSANTPTVYSWTFDGGSPSSSAEQNPSVTYNTAGIYTVSLYVENTAGNSTETKVNYITVLSAVVGDLVITEIMYNPPETDNDTLEYIEIYNNSDSEVNLMAYSFTSGISYVFPDIDLGISDYLVIAKDSLAVMGTFGIDAYQWVSGSLSNGGELLLLESPAGITVDSVPFEDVNPWPEAADGDGPSITICDPSMENSIGETWHASVNLLGVNANGDAIYGSPGMAPAPVADFEADVTSFPGSGGQVEFTDLATCNADSYLWEFEGGTPATSTDTDPIIMYNTAGDFDVSLTVTNTTGSHTFTMEEYIHVGVGTLEQVFEQISIFPNPSNGFYNIHNPNQENMNLAVYNILGELIMDLTNDDKDFSLDLLNEQNGVYLLQIIIGNETKTIRIIKQ